MKNLLQRSYIWCKRFRYRQGYGVHSPNDFLFIHSVIYEDTPYYAYESLHHLRRVVAHLPNYREKVDRLIFRIVNYLQPQTIVEIGTVSGLTCRYMVAAKVGANLYAFYAERCEAAARILTGKPTVCYEPLSALLSDSLPMEHVDLLHIACMPDCEFYFERMLPYLHADSCVLVAKPYASEARKAWWKKIIADERTGVTFDLHDIGIIFMDKRRVKEHRIINFL